jgi:hypothetical protein
MRAVDQRPCGVWTAIECYEFTNSAMQWDYRDNRDNRDRGSDYG